jgi:hypothetical protein
MSHRVSLVLAIEGFPVNWQSIKIPNVSVACPLCQAFTHGDDKFNKALEHWIARGRQNSDFLRHDAKDSKETTDKDNGMDYKTQQANLKKHQEERNRKVINQLTNGGKKTSTKRSTNNKKSNHLRLV